MGPQASKPIRFKLDRTRALWLCAFGAVLTGIILWGGLQPADLLEPLIHADKMRHVIGFGTLDLLAAMAPSPRSRLAGALAACGFGLRLELIQDFTPDRTMSGRDFVASSIGVFSGLGFGSALLTRVGVARAWRAPKPGPDAWPPPSGIRDTFATPAPLGRYRSACGCRDCPLRRRRGSPCRRR